MDINEFITNSLNEPQREAVTAINGPLLILAGAGSGKTRVLTYRMANIIAQGEALADEILCVTFTNKAAREMESRIFQILSEMNIPVHQQLWISTFHSFCVRVLRHHLTLLDYKPFFGIYDSSDQLSQIKKVMTALNINEKMYPAKNFQWRISSAKMLAQSPEQFIKGSKNINDRKTYEVYSAYEKEMKKSNVLDFDDLLVKTYELFRMYPDLLKQYQEKLKFIMVDEYQDTNHIQYLLIKLLAEGHRNLCVVGDEDQSIYSWRGADISNILDFEKDFREAKTVKLEENYRSSGHIVKAASCLIKNNSTRKDKTLFTSNPDGELIAVREEQTEYDEARLVAKTINNMMAQGEGSFNDFAIFYRTNAQSRVLEEQLRTQSIPYRIVGGTRFYERMEIKNVISYMKLALNPADDVAFKRIINVPARGIGKTTLEKLEEFAYQRQLCLADATNVATLERLFNAGTTSKLRRFLDLLEEVRQDAKNFKLIEFYPILLDKTGYLTSLKAEDSTEADARVQNLEELHNAISQFVRERGEEGGIQTYLEEMALVSDLDSLNQDANTVTLMTLHISKGLEYPYVFVVGMEENLFPSGRAGSEESDLDDMEEERRLAYVGMTRARQKLWLTYAKSRRVWGQEQFNSPSRFLKEIPKEMVDFKTALGNVSSRFVAQYGQPKFQNRNSNNFESETQAFPDYDDNSLGYNSATATTSGWTRGERVRHPTFGSGTIYSIEGSGDSLKVSVLFSDQTIKKFVAKYARLERI